jgi:hypothetical protein
MPVSRPGNWSPGWAAAVLVRWSRLCYAAGSSCGSRLVVKSAAGMGRA